MKKSTPPALSPAARREWELLGPSLKTCRARRAALPKRPSSFSRGMRVELPGVSMILLSGTASVDTNGQCAHRGDFRAQCLRTYRNLTTLLEAEGATWHDVVRATCYLKNMKRDYAAFNEVRSAFFAAAGLDPVPASTGIQVELCWPELLVEIEAMAIVPSRKGRR